MKKKIAFTLAEVLITLAIIGVVSALVIPSVLKNYNDKKYNTARLKALKTFGEAGKMASINGEINGQENARAFVENVLSKYLKIVKVCENNKAQECNFPERVKPSNPNLVRFGYLSSNNYNTWYNIGGSYNYTYNDWTDRTNSIYSAYIMTSDGFSAKIFYNPKCVRNSHENPNGPCTKKECSIYAVDATCMNVIYDMNGIKNPNHVGEDIGFVTVFWSGLNPVATAPGIISYEDAKNISDEGCKSNDEASLACTSKRTDKIQYTLPDINELWSLIINREFSQISCEYCISGTSMPQSNDLWASHAYGSRFGASARCTRAWCVRR